MLTQSQADAELYIFWLRSPKFKRDFLEYAPFSQKAVDKLIAELKDLKSRNKSLAVAYTKRGTLEGKPFVANVNVFLDLVKGELKIITRIFGQTFTSTLGAPKLVKIY